MRHFIRKSGQDGVIEVRPLTKPSLADGRVLIESVRFGIVKRVPAISLILDG